MKKVLGVSFGIWFFYLMQSSVFRNLEFAGIVPNFMLMYVTTIGLILGKRYGLVVGFFVGIIIDTFSLSIIGIYALFYMLIGYVNGCFAKIFYPEDIKLLLVLVAMSDFTLNFIIYILMFLLRGKIDLIYYILNIIMPEIVYTILVTMLIYPIFLGIRKQLKKENLENLD